MTDTNDNLNPNGLTWMGKRLEDCTREELIRAAVLTAESKLSNDLAERHDHRRATPWGVLPSR